MEFKAAVTIDAPTDKVWEVLGDLASYPEWDPTCTATTGAIAEGAKISITTTLGSGRTFKLVVSDVNPGHKMVWTGGMPLGLMTGRRVFVITAKDSDVSRLVVKETFSGLLLPLFGSSIPNMNGPFEQFCQALKQRVEGR